MKKMKKALALSVLCSLASVGFVMSAGAAEQMETHAMDEVLVEDQAVQATLPGGMLVATDRVGIYGNLKAVDVPFTQRNYSQKVIESFSDPDQGINGVLANNPSIRVSSPSPMYTDFNMRGININATQYFINGVPNMFNQTRSIPAYVLESFDIVSGPNTVINGSSFSNNGTNGYDAPAGMLNGTTKKATDKDINRYTQRFSGRGTWTENLDLGRRFGKDNQWGVRVNLHKEDGKLSLKGNKIDDKTVYINVDQRSKKSTTNIFGGYFDWEIDGGQTWLNASGVKKLVKPTKGWHNLSLEDQVKSNYGYLMTVNHVQKFSDKWSMFANLGMNHYNEHKNDPGSGSLTLKDDGILAGNYRNYKSESKGFYGQMGVSNEAKVGNVTNQLNLAVDYFNYNSKATNKTTSGNLITGDIWNGVTFPADKRVVAPSLDTVGFGKEQAKAVTLADRLEIGKTSAYIGLQLRDSMYRAAGKKEITKTSLNPTYSLAYKPESNKTIYASHSQSYTRPMEVGVSYENAGEILEPIKNKQYEIGYKFESGKLLHSMAYFDLRQAQYISEDKGAAKPFYTQSGEFRYKGVEYSVAGKLGNKWNLMGGVMYLNGKVVNSATKDRIGKRAAAAPRWNGVLVGEYEANEKTSFLLRTNFTSEARVFYNGVETPAHMTFDLGMTYKTKMGNTGVKLQAMCYNLLGKDYWLSRNETGVALGAPRSLSLTATFDL